MNTSQEVKTTGDIRAQFLCSIEDAARLLGIGRSLMIEVLNDGAVKRKEIKGRILVAVADLETFSAELVKWQGEYREVKRAKPNRKSGLK